MTNTTQARATDSGTINEETNHDDVRLSVRRNTLLAETELPRAREEEIPSSSEVHPASIARRRISLVPNVDEPPQRGGTASPIWEPVTPEPRAVPTTSEVLAASRPPQQLTADLEEKIMATLSRPLLPGEGHQLGNDNRERELRGLLVTLTPIQAFHLRRRLELDRNNDQLAVAFRRLVVERRVRLRAFLADPRRQVCRLAK